MSTNGSNGRGGVAIASTSPRRDHHQQQQRRARHNIPLTTFFERTDPAGRRYLIGRLGHARVIIVPTEQRSRGDRMWEAVFAEGPDTATIAAIDLEKV